MVLMSLVFVHVDISEISLFRALPKSDTQYGWHCWKCPERKGQRNWRAGRGRRETRKEESHNPKMREHVANLDGHPKDMLHMHSPPMFW